MLISSIRKDGKLTLAMIGLTIAVLAIAPFFASTSLLLTLITALMYSILAVSWTMFSGPTRYVSLATAALFGVGMYSSAVLRQSWPLPVIVLFGGLAAVALAFGIGVLTLRLKGVYFILFTFGVTALIRNAVQWWEAKFTLTVGRHVPGATNESVYWFILVIFAATLVTGFLLRHSSIGKALQAIGENEEAAEHLGVPVTRIKILTFAASAVFMGATGALLATRWRYVDPNIAFNPLLSFLPVLMAIFGGVSRLFGPVLGAVVFVVLREFLITNYPYVYMLLFGLALVVVVLWLPGGLTSLVERWYFRAKIWWLKMKMWWRRVVTS